MRADSPVLAALAVLAVLLPAPPGLDAQTGAGAETLTAAAAADTAAKFRVNFTVPDAPAFDILDVVPGSILRPASVQELGLAASSFAGPDNTFRVPRSLAVEFAPYLLARGRDLTLQQYRGSFAAQRLQSLRFSGATNRSADSARTQVGVGIRVNLLDRADPRLDNRLVNQLTAIADSINTLYVKVLTTGSLPLDVGSGVVSPEILGAAAREQVEQLQAQSEELKAAFEEEHWNDQVLDVAYALRFSAADSLGNDPRADAHTVWATLGLPVRSWGQFLLGVRAGMDRPVEEEDFGRTASAAARFYAGTNDYKFFVESELRDDRVSNGDLLFHGGGELNVVAWAWTTFSFGLERDPDTRKRRLVTRISLKSGLPKLP